MDKQDITSVTKELEEWADFERNSEVLMRLLDSQVKSLRHIAAHSGDNAWKYQHASVTADALSSVKHVVEGRIEVLKLLLTQLQAKK